LTSERYKNSIPLLLHGHMLAFRPNLNFHAAYYNFAKITSHEDLLHYTVYRFKGYKINVFFILHIFLEICCKLGPRHCCFSCVKFTIQSTLHPFSSSGMVSTHINESRDLWLQRYCKKYKYSLLVEHKTTLHLHPLRPCESMLPQMYVGVRSKGRSLDF